MTLDFYKKKNKEKLSKKARQRHQYLSEKEKDKKRQYAREQYKNISEEWKEKKRQYGREWCKNILENENRKKNYGMQEMDYLSKTSLIESTLGWSTVYNKFF